MRRILAVAAAFLALPAGASSQQPAGAPSEPAVTSTRLDVTLNFGVYFDRLGQPHRRITTADDEVYSTKGEALTLGMRATYWLKPQLGVAAGFATSRNQSWSGGGAAPIPTMTKRTSFGSLTAVWRPFDPTQRVQLRLGFGPAVVVHSGSGESLLDRQWDLGVVGSVGIHVRVSESVQLGFDLQNYRFNTDFRQVSGFGGREISRGEVVSRSEWLLLPAIRWVP